jgi:hypothetical protein
VRLAGGFNGGATQASLAELEKAMFIVVLDRVSVFVNFTSPLHCVVALSVWLARISQRQ